METPLSPLDFMRRTRKLFAHREAVVAGEKRFTYAEFFNRCDRWSLALQRLGIQPGDRVATISPNIHGLLEAFYAVPQMGAVLVPMNYRLSGDDFVYILNHCGARMVCVSREYLDIVDQIRERLPKVERFVSFEEPKEPLKEPLKKGWIDYEAELKKSDLSEQFQVHSFKEGDLLTINYTSGTTARPKGVMITHRNAWINCVGVMVHTPMSSSERYLWTLPMFHANGWTFVWIITAVGGTHICLRRVETEQVFQQLVSEKVSMLCAAPTILIGLANAPSNLKSELNQSNRVKIRVFTAGAPPAATTIARIEVELGWEIIHVYGLTETSPFISINQAQPEILTNEAKSSYKARQGVELITSGELLVIDADGQEVPRDAQTIGEIVARGNGVMLGYFNDPEATSQTIRDGYFHSGDAAVVHPDGSVEIKDRIKDVIISGGENISSIEVEGTLLQHPSIQEVAVVGMPDEKWGESPHAFVILRSERMLTDAELRHFTRERLAHFKCPQAFHFVSELPKTATGKVQKYLLRGKRSAISVQ